MASDFVMNIKSTSKNIELRMTSNDYSNSTHTAKLPNLIHMKFNGDPLQWSKFWDLFRMSIHERIDIAPCGKFQYLLAQLDVDSSNLLSGFDQTRQEYHEAVNLLQITYGSPRSLVQARLAALFELKSPLPCALSLGEFCFNYEGHLQALKLLGCNIDDAGYVYAELLLGKLPEKTKHNINGSSKADTWTLSALREAIVKEIGHLQFIEDQTTQQQGSTATNSSNNIQLYFFVILKLKFAKILI